MAEFDMTLRDRQVHIIATIESLDPMLFSIEVHDKETSEVLPWHLSRNELIQVARAAAKRDAGR